MQEKKLWKENEKQPSAVKYDDDDTVYAVPAFRADYQEDCPCRWITYKKLFAPLDVLLLLQLPDLKNVLHPRKSVEVFQSL